MKGRLVSNAGPIIALSGIDRLEILKRIFEEIIEGIAVLLMGKENSVIENERRMVPSEALHAGRFFIWPAFPRTRLLPVPARVVAMNGIMTIFLRRFVVRYPKHKVRNFDGL